MADFIVHEVCEEQEPPAEEEKPDVVTPSDVQNQPATDVTPVTDVPASVVDAALVTDADTDAAATVPSGELAKTGPWWLAFVLTAAAALLAAGFAAMRYRNCLRTFKK
ncbi:MAG: hypothetical protein JWM07_493 [Candidatus Saccharibacteria bacterium]|nr:hypothetical protein [Candidatus Saccharibacteria bacterium]